MYVSITASTTIPLRKELTTLRKYIIGPFAGETIKPPEQGLGKKSRIGRQVQNRKLIALHRK